MLAFLEDSSHKTEVGETVILVSLDALFRIVKTSISVKENQPLTGTTYGTKAVLFVCSTSVMNGEREQAAGTVSARKSSARVSPT